jgi:hypothetical protein
VVQGRFGAGWVLLSGIHAEAPASWRKGPGFDTPVRDTQAFAAALFRSALAGAPMASY